MNERFELPASPELERVPIHPVVPERGVEDAAEEAAPAPDLALVAPVGESAGPEAERAVAPLNVDQIQALPLDGHSEASLRLLAYEVIRAREAVSPAS